MRKIITSVIAVVGVLTAFADNSNHLGTSSSPVATPTIKYPWESSVSAGLTLTRGNSDTMLFTADFLTKRKTPTDEYLLGVGGAYGDQNSKETANFYKAFGQWNHLFSERLFGYVRTDGLRDLIADVDYRLTVGPGAGYYLIKQTNTTLAVEAGGAFETQKLGHKDDTFVTVRLAERFEHKFNDRARLWESAEFLPQVDKWDNYVVNFEIGLESSITKSFSLKTFLDDTYADRPARSHKKNDLKLVAAVAYKF